MWLVPNVKDDTSYFYIISTVLYIVTVLGPLLAVMDHLIILVYLVKMVWMAPGPTRPQLNQQGQMVPQVHLGAIVYGYMFVWR